MIYAPQPPPSPFDDRQPSPTPATAASPIQRSHARRSPNSETDRSYRIRILGDPVPGRASFTGFVPFRRSVGRNMYPVRNAICPILIEQRKGQVSAKAITDRRTSCSSCRLFSAGISAEQAMFGYGNREDVDLLSGRNIEKGYSYESRRYLASKRRTMPGF